MIGLSHWGSQTATHARSASSPCQLWLWVYGQGERSTLKERFEHLGMRRCQLGSCTPAVCVSECALMLERGFHGCNCDRESKAHLSDASEGVCICGLGLVI